MAKAPAPKRDKRGRHPRNAKRRKGFAAKFSGGPAAHNETVKRVEDAERILKRQADAWTLLRSGATFAEIGKQLGVSGKTAWYDCMAHWEALEKHYALPSALRVSRIDARLQRTYLQASNAMQKSGADQKAATAVMLDCIRQERQLFGLDAKRTDVVPVETVTALLRIVSALFLELVPDTDLRRRWAEALRTRTGGLGEAQPGLPDVAVPPDGVEGLPGALGASPGDAPETGDV